MLKFWCRTFADTSLFILYHFILWAAKQIVAHAVMTQIKCTLPLQQLMQNGITCRRNALYVPAMKRIVRSCDIDNSRAGVNAICFIVVPATGFRVTLDQRKYLFVSDYKKMTWQIVIVCCKWRRASELWKASWKQLEGGWNNRKEGGKLCCPRSVAIYFILGRRNCYANPTIHFLETLGLNF